MLNPNFVKGGLVVAPFFTEEECDNILKLDHNWVEGQIFYHGMLVTNKEVRSVTIDKNELPENLLNLIFMRVFDINRQTYRYHLEGYSQHDLPRLFSYSGERGDHYDWHRDTVHSGDYGRKLSFSIQLTDGNEYEGGDLEFLPPSEATGLRKKGNIVLFPAFYTHRVIPVTKGIRNVIVGWIYGPEFK